VDLNERLPILPHDFLGDTDHCCGCLFVLLRGDEADIVCNEGEEVIRTVPAADAEAAFLELAQEFAPAEICSATCPRCGVVRTFPGFSSIEAFVCHECGEGVVLRPKVQ
jgi:hypothetical protein